MRKTVWMLVVIFFLGVSARGQEVEPPPALPAASQQSPAPAPAAAGLAASSSLTLNTAYSASDGSFRVYFPGTPKESTAVTTDINGNPETQHRLTYDAGSDYALRVMYTDLPFRIRSDREGLDSIVDAGFRHLQGWVIDGRRYLTVGGFPAEYAKGHIASISIADEAIVVGHRLYVLTFVGGKGLAAKDALEDAQRFFDSFTLLRKSEGAASSSAPPAPAAAGPAVSGKLSLHRKR